MENNELLTLSQHIKSTENIIYILGYFPLTGLDHRIITSQIVINIIESKLLTFDIIKNNKKLFAAYFNNIIVSYQLPMDFIEENFLYKGLEILISKFQNVTKEFIYNHLEEVDLHILMERKLIFKYDLLTMIDYKFQDDVKQKQFINLLK